MFFVYEFYNSSITLAGAIEDYISYSYEKGFTYAGEFSLLLPYSEEIYNLVSRSSNKDKLIQIEDFLGVIHKVTIKTQVETKRIQIKGKQAASILSRYNLNLSTAHGIPTTEVLDNHFDVDLSTRMAQAKVTFAAESAYHFPTFIFIDLTKYQEPWIQPRLYMQSNPIKGHTWFEYVQAGCLQNDLGFDLVLSSSSLELVLLFPTERNNIVFHSQIQDFLDSEYTINSQNMYTLCEVNITNINYEDSSVSGGISTTSVSAEARQKGISESDNRGAVLSAYVMDVDGSNLTLPSLSACQRYALGLAKSFLANHRLVNSYSANLDLLKTGYNLGVDYALGDTIEIVDNNTKLHLQAQLSSYTRSASNNGKIQVKPTFGYDQVTLTQLLTRNQIV